MTPPLAGYTVGITGDRRWEEQAEMLTRRGARVIHGPTMRTELLGDSEATIAATKAMLAEPIDLVALTTGIGTRSWFAAAESHGLDDRLRRALRDTLVVARGPKAAAAAGTNGVDVDWTAAGETNAELREWLLERGVAGKRIAIQRDGGAPLLARELAAHGAIVTDIPVYRWHLPLDAAPARRVLDGARSGAVDIVTFTCSYAVHSAFELSADPLGLATAFNESTLAVAVGPVTAAALASRGVTRVVEPKRARLGSMVHALITEVAGQRRTLRLGEHTLTWQGCALVDRDERAVELTPLERRVLSTLVDHAPAVVAKSELVEGSADVHAAEVAVARLRSRLGPLGEGIRTVRRRGYACTIEVVAGSSTVT